MKIFLTDRYLRGLKAAPPGKRTIIWDAAVPGAYISVTATGNISFNIMKRIPGRANSLRRKVGFAWTVGQPLPISLAELRDMARDMLLDMAKGIDPKAKQSAAHQVTLLAARSTFAAMAKDFLEDHVSGLRSARSVKLTFESAILPVLGKLPIASVTDQDVIRCIKPLASKGHRYRARNTFAHIRKMFHWAIGQRAYGLTASPCTGLSMKDLVGKVSPRVRVLTDVELAAVWKAADSLGGPAGAFTRMLLLVGQRLREVAGMTGPEIDLDKALWTIPADRMKADVGHVVPLAPEALAILKSLPRGPGPFVFSSCGGRKPLAGFSKLKARVDAAMPEKIEPWRFHDLRRSMRTGLSALGVADIVSELVIAHTQKGLHRVYDQHSYLAEKRSALERWERHLLLITRPAPAKVLEFAGGRRNG